MSRFRLYGYIEGATSVHIEECDTADAAVGIGRRLAARGLVVFAGIDRGHRRWQELALFVGNNMLPDRTVAPADNPLLAVTKPGPAPAPARCTTTRRAPPPR